MSTQTPASATETLASVSAKSAAANGGGRGAGLGWADVGRDFRITVAIPSPALLCDRIPRNIDPHVYLAFTRL
ncbi:hypothetical protein CMUS01_00351 [Colletotrichum musicola]|uniref:Uncharacterized protein n=1 Tax=Colletotrichum musicola TaxID=2175873 RepID=A0A8H6NZ37_9PEZI|nr:hypothetical protein CMUS01_00351 [Colletotrichum musicola]